MGSMRNGPPKVSRFTHRRSCKDHSSSRKQKAALRPPPTQSITCVDMWSCCFRRPTEGERMMRFMIIVKATKSSEAGVMPGAQLLPHMGKFNQQLMEAGVMLDGAGVQSSSKGARGTFSGQDSSVAMWPF